MVFLIFYFTTGLLIGQQGQYYFPNKVVDLENIYDPSLQSSMIVPYHETFDGFQFNKMNNLWKIEYFHNRHGINFWFDGIDDNTFLALQVYPKDVIAMGNCLSLENCPELDTLSCCNSRDRCEAKIFPHHANGTYTYGWRFMVPDNFVFQSKGNDANNLGEKTRHFIAQWHQAYHYESTRRYQTENPVKVKWKYEENIDCNGRDLNIKAKPPVTFNLMHDDLDSDNRLDLIISYGTQYNYHWLEKCTKDTNSIIGGRAYLVENIVAPGEWVDILTEISWSSNIDSAYMSIWINEIPYEIQMKKGTRVLVKSRADFASKLKGANLYIDVNNFAQPNYLKLGHYRSNMSTSHIIYIDDVVINRVY